MKEPREDFAVVGAYSPEDVDDGPFFYERNGDLWSDGSASYTWDEIRGGAEMDDRVLVRLYREDDPRIVALYRVAELAVAWRQSIVDPPDLWAGPEAMALITEIDRATAGCSMTTGR